VSDINKLSRNDCQCGKLNKPKITRTDRGNAGARRVKNCSLNTREKTRFGRIS
jgi:hypothetical protein